jgi:hypothetical protein
MSKEPNKQCFHSRSENLQRLSACINVLQNGVSDLFNKIEQDPELFHYETLLLNMRNESATLHCSLIELKLYADGTGYYDPKLPPYEPPKEYSKQELDAAVEKAVEMAINNVFETSNTFEEIN